MSDVTAWLEEGLGADVSAIFGGKVSDIIASVGGMVEVVGEGVGGVYLEELTFLNQDGWYKVNPGVGYIVGYDGGGVDGTGVGHGVGGVGGGGVGIGVGAATYLSIDRTRQDP